ncbi:hypothetical protein [Flavobacterium hungaricum]|uniref:Uncharacterized protein n=1 Tax=Flavobacterium hungaricum TaxID=2082725 RepID=A0ABR9THX2_9FLAO|nr:hypothetical protein [Flavobacterium hungaricum]MBE8724624.1 hypothetical protein [Flavobacterium hungaricum]
MSKSKLQLYFYSILVASIVWLLIFPKPLKNFAPIIFAIPTFPVFVFNFFDKLMEFSRILKIKNSELFTKHVSDSGSFSNYNKGLVIDIYQFNNNKDLEDLKRVNLYEKYILCKELIKLTFISFIFIALLGIATIYIKTSIF